jgi:hypothetical protein
MRPRTQPGISPSAPGRLPGSTFIELVLMMLLIVLFAALAFPLYWSANKATLSLEANNALERSALTLATILPRLTAEIRPPYWESPDHIFASSGDALSVRFFGGSKDGVLNFRKDGDSRLVITTPTGSFAIGNLQGLSLGWWKTDDDRIVGIVAEWAQGRKKVQFHAAWGSYSL